MQHPNLAQSNLSLKEQINRGHLSYPPQNNVINCPQLKKGNGYHSNGHNHLSEYEKIIQDILGYPVTAIILDEVGEIILDIGDLITYQAVDRAIKANVFNHLLKAVYRKQ